MTALDLTSLKELAQAATPGPWEPVQFDDLYVVGNNKPAGEGRYCVAANIRSAADAALIAAANPAVVLELIARLERAEEMLAASSPSNRHGELSIVMSMRQRDTLFSAGRHLSPEQIRSFAGGATNHVSLEASRVYQDLQDHISGSMPNDPLDDVLPLPADTTREKMHAALAERITSTPEAHRFAESMAKQMKQGMDGEFIAPAPLRLPSVSLPLPKVLPDNLPASLDLNDNDGEQLCGQCKGTGKVGGRLPCPACGGSGKQP
jgi:hypothetical protein